MARLKHSFSECPNLHPYCQHLCPGVFKCSFQGRAWVPVQDSSSHRIRSVEEERTLLNSMTNYVIVACRLHILQNHPSYPIQEGLRLDYLCLPRPQTLLFLPGWQVHVRSAPPLGVCASSVSSEPPVDPSPGPGSALEPTSLCKQGRTQFRHLRSLE